MYVCVIKKLSDISGRARKNHHRKTTQEVQSTQTHAYHIVQLVCMIQARHKLRVQALQTIYVYDMFVSWFVYENQALLFSVFGFDISGVKTKTIITSTRERKRERDR